MSTVTNATTSAAANTNSSSSSSSANSAGLSALSANFDSFLKLLVTQLQNQDPTAPMDPSQFTNQIALFSQVQQQVETNSNLSKLADLNTNLANTISAGNTATANALNKLIGISGSVNPGVYYVGHTVEAPGNQTEIDSSGYAPIAFKTDSAADDVTINVTDSNGNSVGTYDLGAANGYTKIAWDGTTSAGAKLTSGVYNFSVNATSGGKPVGVTTYTSGVVSGVEFNGNSATLDVGSLKIDSSKVVAIRG